MKHLWQLQSLLKNIPVKQRIQNQYVNAVFEMDKKLYSKTPSLPVQPLEQTLDKFFRSAQPFLDDNDINVTKKVIENFKKDGAGLQELLVKRSKECENWLAEWWLDVAYLGYRDPVVVFSSPGLVWPHPTFQNLRQQLIYTSYLISFALDFNETIEKGLMPQEKMGKDPLCMIQYNRVFGTNRTPKIPKDILKFQDMKKPSRNIIVMYNNHFFSVEVFNEGSRKPFSPGQFLAALEDIVKQGCGEPGPGVGVLTSDNRDNWAVSYEELIKDKTNKCYIEEYIEKSLFVVCIDQPLNIGKQLSRNTRCGMVLLHGCGGSYNGSNRWYDKTIQFIVGAGSDGAGVTYEHSPAEGGPIGVVTDFINDRIGKSPKELEADPNYPKPIQLVFNISPAVSEAILGARKRLDCLYEDLDVIGYKFLHFGKNRLKAAKMSPDSFIQLAIQYAFYKTHHYPTAQYESGSLRKYTHGRTDIIRTCSVEVVDFCKTMCNPESSVKEKREALKKAIQAHKEYATEVINARGVDRHLLGLRLLAKSNNMAEPELYSDKSFKKSTYFQLSTSNVPSLCDAFMLYGPIVKDGYACCYNPRNDSINFGTTAWKTCCDTNLNQFVTNLELGLIEMESCLEPAVTSKL